MTAPMVERELIALRTGDTFYRRIISRCTPSVRQIAVLLIIGMACVSCGGQSPTKEWTDSKQKAVGGVVADEPKAALIGYDILSAGGNSIDAIVAMYFTLSATYPGAASLGGGGVCVLHQGEGGEVAAIDFQPSLYYSGANAALIPGAVRGMFALHTRYGRLRWEKLLLPAERLARFGNPVARAAAQNLARLPASEFTDPDLRRIFTKAGRPLTEGQTLRQVSLADTLSRIRLHGPHDFYTGDLAKSLAVGLGRAVGFRVPVSALKSYRPKWLKPEVANFHRDQIYFPGGPVGRRGVALWRTAGKFKKLDAGATNNGDSVGFVAIDADGGAVACVVSSNGVFGARRMIGATGILMAALPGGNTLSGMPFILVSKKLSDTKGAVTGAGGSNAVVRAIVVAARGLRERINLETVFKTMPSDMGGRVNLIRCPEGARNKLLKCRYASDPAGYGLAASSAN
ncbi:MAG: gamma-glutamyltransferase [Pseudomonadota bacterium]|nr:gamma-glutamyltransferase [Pseudomonadota bacterium]